LDIGSTYFIIYNIFNLKREGVEMRINIKEILFWILLTASAILILWMIFGNSPSEFIAITSILFMITLKIWALNDRQMKSEFKVKNRFDRIASDMEILKADLQLIKNKLRIR